MQVYNYDFILQPIDEQSVINIYWTNVINNYLIIAKGSLVFHMPRVKSG